MPKITIPYNFVPRDYQIPLMDCLENGYKRACVVWHRRAGKDKCLINIMAKEMFKRVGSYYYMFPTARQGRKVLWEGMDRNGFKHLDHIPQQVRRATNNTEMKLDITNNSIFRVIGTDNFDSSMGTNPVGCIFSEYSLQDPRVWSFFMPILIENDGWAIFNFTPRGMNFSYDLYMAAKANPKTWFSQLLTYKDTGAVSEEQIQQIRNEGLMSESMIQQEFMCDFSSTLSGCCFQNEMRLAEEQKRICRIPVETGIPVHSFWDLGISDSTAIWLVQFVGKEVRCVGYYEQTGEGLSHYANWLRDWRSKYNVSFGEHVLPHDAKIRDLSTGKSRIEFLYDLGLNCTVAAKPSKKEDAIESSRQMISRVWFDSERCALGIDCLKRYHAEIDEVNGVLKSKPVHDKHSHAADAFQTLSVWFDTNGSPADRMSVDQLLGESSGSWYSSAHDLHSGGWMK